MYTYTPVSVPSVKPSWLHTTSASLLSHRSSQMVPHVPPKHTSTLPSCSFLPLVKLTSPSLQPLSVSGEVKLSWLQMQTLFRFECNLGRNSRVTGTCIALKLHSPLLVQVEAWFHPLLYENQVQDTYQSLSASIAAILTLLRTQWLPYAQSWLSTVRSALNNQSQPPWAARSMRSWIYV